MQLKDDLTTLMHEWKTRFAILLDKVGLQFCPFDEWKTDTIFSKDDVVFIRNSKTFLIEFYKSLIDNNQNKEPQKNKDCWERDETLQASNYIFDNEIEDKLQEYIDTMPASIVNMNDIVLFKKVLFLRLATFFDLTKAKNGGTTATITSQSAEGYSVGFAVNEQQLTDLRNQSTFGIELKRLLETYTIPVIGIELGIS